MNEEKIEEILKNIGTEDIPPDIHKVAEEVSRDFNKTLTQQNQPVHIVLGDYIMKNRLTKLALTAAAVIVIVLVGLPFFDTESSGVTLAGVLAKIEQAKAFMYKIKITRMGDLRPGLPDQQEITATVSNEYGIKWEMDATDPNTGEKTTHILYVLPDQKMVVGLMPKRKQYMQRELDDDWLARMKRQNSDPREVIKQIMNCKYTELGRSTIDGIEVVGFQTTDPDYFVLGSTTEEKVFTLWVDAENWLPVRSELNYLRNEQTQTSTVTYDYQWNVRVYADEFEPIIPQDFTALPEDGIKMPGMNEEAAIEGLRLFVEIAGRYPNKLNMLDLAQEISESLKGSEYILKEVRKLKEEMSQNGELTKEEFRNAAIKKTMGLTQPLQSPGWFYTLLVKDKKEPIYYGESVGPDDSDAVLMRWKVSEGKYRVIFGNLTTADVTAEELAELENSLLEQ